MGEIYLESAIEWFESQTGYSSGSTKSSKYSRLLDSVDFYESQKEGNANWDLMFIDYGIYKTAEFDDINEIKSILCGENCVERIKYFKRIWAWRKREKIFYSPKKGDLIFFGSNKDKSKENPYGVHHAGIVVNRDEKGIYTIEGNTNGKGDVSKRFYFLNDNTILGYGRPKWTGVDDMKQKSKIDKTEVTPTFHASTTPAIVKIEEVEYTVTAPNGLYLRANAPVNTYSIYGSGATIATLACGDIFKETKRENKWSYGTSNGKTGWVCNEYLTKN